MTLLHVIFASSALATTPPCTLSAPPATRTAPTAPARMMLEVRLAADTPTPLIDATLAPLIEAGLPVTVLVPPGWSADDPAWRLPARGVDVGVIGTLDDIVGQPVTDPGAMSLADWRVALKSSKRAVQRATHKRATVLAVPPPTPTGEVAIDEAGFQALFLIDPGDAAAPRRARAYGGRTGRTRVVTEGAGVDACGAQLGTPLPSALDRIARVGPSQVVTRVALAPSADEARAVALWWTHTAAPAEWKAWSVGTLYVRAGTTPLAPKPAEAPPVAQASLTTDRLAQATETITTVGRLPRVLPGDLTLTEAFVGLAAMAADPGHPAYPVPYVGPPPGDVRSVLTGPTPLEEAAVRQAATALLPSLGDHLPTLVNVGAHTLTAGEFLLVLAQLQRGLAPVARPIGSPDPFAEGAGWGTVR